VLLLGQGQGLRNLLGVDGGVDACSAAYGYGEWAGIAGSVAAGGMAGLRAAGVRGSQGARTTFSHFLSRTATNPKSTKYVSWLDNRFGRWLTRGNNRLNGNYVRPERHFRHDSDYWGHWRGGTTGSGASVCRIGSQ
jgi:hypothetical protein